MNRSPILEINHIETSNRLFVNIAKVHAAYLENGALYILTESGAVLTYKADTPEGTIAAYETIVKAIREYTMAPTCCI